MVVPLLLLVAHAPPAAAFVPGRVGIDGGGGGAGGGPGMAAAGQRARPSHSARAPCNVHDYHQRLAGRRWLRYAADFWDWVPRNVSAG